MSIVKTFKNLLKKEKSLDKKTGLMELSDIFKGWGINVNDIENSSDISETIYYICLKHLSETMSKMPWEKRQLTKKKGKERILDNEMDILLNLRPNPYMQATTFWSTVELNKIHHGNAYIYLETNKNNGKIKYLWILPSASMEIWIDDDGILGKEDGMWYIWNDSRTGKRYSFSKDEIIHIKTHMTFDGLAGMPMREILKAQINTGKSSIGFLNRLYKNNMFGSKVIVHYTGELNPEAETALAGKLEQYSKNTGSGKFIPLPYGVQAQLLDMKLADAQFFENNKVSALQLAAALGIKPNVINDYTKSSYSNSESQQVDFYVNTLQPLFKSYEQELTYKLLTDKELKQGIRLEINEKILFKMDNSTQAEVYSKYLNNFGMTPNEVREELNLPYIEGGDKLIGNGNVISMDKVGIQYERKGGEKSE